MRKLSLLLLLSFWFVSLSFAHPGRTDSDGGHYKNSDGSYHYHGGGGLGDWTGTESIGAWLGVLLVVGFIVWFIREYPNSKEQYEKEKQSKLEYEKKYSNQKNDFKSEIVYEDELNTSSKSKNIDSLTLYTLEKGKVEIKGLENGKSIEYYEDGSKLYEGDWVNGKQEGTSYTYFKNGNQWLQLNYKNGKLDGSLLANYPNGNLKYTKTYVDGILQEEDSIYFGENGNLIKEQQELDSFDEKFNDGLQHDLNEVFKYGSKTGKDK